MANTNNTHMGSRRIAVIKTNLRNLTFKVQRTASSIGFIKKCLYKGFVPKFAKLAGQFVTTEDKLHAEFDNMKKHLKLHQKNLLVVLKEQDAAKNLLTQTVGRLFSKLIFCNILKHLRK